MNKIKEGVNDELKVKMSGFMYDEKSKNEKYNIKIDGENFAGFKMFFNNAKNLKIEGNVIKVQEVPQVALTKEEKFFTEDNLKDILDMLYYVLIENKNLFPNVKEVTIIKCKKEE